MSDRSDSIHPPTRQRIQRARRDGQVPRSRDLVWAGIWIASVSAIAWIGPVLIERWKNLAISSWDAETLDQTRIAPFHGVATILPSLVPLLLLIALATMVMNLGQGGWGVFPGRLAPSLSRLRRQRRLFSMESLLNGINTTLKILCLISVSALFLYWKRDEWMMLGATNLNESFGEFSNLCLAFAIQVAIVLAAFGLIDYGIARLEFLQNLRMTDQELRDEQRELESDPHVHAARSVLQRERQASWRSGNESSPQEPTLEADHINAK